MYSCESDYSYAAHFGVGGNNFITLQPPPQFHNHRDIQRELPNSLQIDQSGDLDRIRKFRKEDLSKTETIYTKSSTIYTKSSKQDGQEKKKKRNKIADETQWRRNIAKKARNEGRSYTTANGKSEMISKAMGPNCGCKKKCMEVIGIEKCKAIFDAFYGMGDWNRQTAYITNLVQSVPVKRRRGPPKRKRKGNKSKEDDTKQEETTDEENKDSDDHENLTCPDGPSCTGNCQIQDDKDEDNPDSPSYNMECDVIINDDYADINDSTVDNMVSQLVKNQKMEKEKKVLEKCRVKEIFEYYIQLKGKRLRVCKKAWLNIHGVTDSRVYYALKKKVSQYGVVELDKRGKHENLYRKLEPISSKLAIEHIKMFPKKSFHHPKPTDPNKKHVQSGLTMREMYDMYLEWLNVAHPGIQPVAWPTYQKFKKKYY